MFERFTEPARQVVVLAQDEARALKHNYIGTEHLLLGLLREEEGLAARTLQSLGITVEEVRAQVARIVGWGDEAAVGQIPFTPRAKKVLELALREALSLGHDYIGTEHLLLGLVAENEGVAARILLDFDGDPEKIRNEVIRVLSGGQPRPAHIARETPQLRHVLRAVERARERLIREQRYEEEAGLREKQHRFEELLAEIQAGLRELDPPGPSARGAETAGWEYDIRTLQPPVETWPEQLAAWRRDGWELLTVTEVDEGHRALLERRP